MSNIAAWTRACAVTDIPRQDVRRWDWGGRTFAIFRSERDEFFATSNVCTHEHAYLSDGYVDGYEVECPRHAGIFDFRTGRALGAPVCINLKTFPVKVEDGSVFVLVE